MSLTRLEIRYTDVVNEGLKNQFLVESPLDSLSAQWVASHLPSRQIQSIFTSAPKTFLAFPKLPENGCKNPILRLTDSLLSSFWALTVVTPE